MAARTRRRFASGPTTAHRATPLLAAAAAIALTVAVFPDALHSSVAGPGPQGAVQPHAQASVTHEGDVPPLSLGQSGAGADGSGAGTGRPSAVQFGGQSGGLGAGSNHGFGAGAGAGAGIGGGSGSGPGVGSGASQPSPTPGPGGPSPPPPSHSAGTTPTPPPSCSSCQGRQGSPSIPFCYSNSLGPDSQTTEDPLSPPCMAWDGRDNGGATSRGVTGHDDPTCPDCIQVAILGANPFYDADVNSDAPVQAGPALPTGEDLRVLRQYFQSHFQTFGRRVWFRGWGYPCPASSAKDAIDSMVKELHPFAVIMGQYSDGGWCNTPQAEVDADLTAHGLETFVFSSPEGKYFGADNLDGSVLHASSPFLWSFQPSVNGDITDGATWVCQTLVGKPPTETIDPTIKAAALTGQPRRLALGYRTVSSLAATSATNANAGDRNAYLSSSKDVADRFAAAVDATCGHGGHVFEQFNCPPSPCDQDLWVEDNYFSGLGAVFGQSNDPQVAANAVSALKSHHDTSLICVLCGVPSSAGEANQNPDEFAEAEYQNQYFPEHIFVGGTDEDPWGARQHDQPTFNGAFGLSELWQVGGYTQTYWYRAYNSVTSQATISMPAGFEIYEQMMQVFSAVQLAGPDLNPTTLQWGSDGRGGLYSWTRGNRPAAGVLHPDSSPAAGYTAQRHWFLRGLVEERWDSGGSPPGGPYQAVFGTAGGCYRIIDPALRYSSEGWPGTAPWPSGPGSDHSDEIAASAPCTGDYGTDV